ncbi:putative bifunctional diguanylate cyclase/phosphodiesterase [Emcibacter sp.]|uniref:putative bifunctional diguanylate cyclase/phosphodiesterase n=1 Tax=Emcibacter sp. TaxID=1979954 RepID=UPI003A907E68
MLPSQKTPYLFRDNKPRFSVPNDDRIFSRQLADGVGEIEVVGDTDFIFSQSSDELISCISYGQQNPIGKLVSEIDWLDDGNQLQSALEEAARSFENIDLSWNFTRPDMEEVSLFCRLIPLKSSEGQIEKFILLTADNSIETAFERELERYTYYDSLTNLPNKHHFYQIIENRFGDDIPLGETAVLFVNIFKLQRINESYGYEVGDDLLREVAHLIQNCLPAEAILARFDGDKFVVLLADEDMHNAESEARALADSIHHELGRKIRLGGQYLQVAATIGISSGSSSLHDLINLIQDAHMAMQRINGLSSDRTLVYRPELKTRAQSLLRMENELSHAIENNQLELHYQPIINLSTGIITGFEALTRWKHPERGMISPVEFIPIAEDTGMIMPMGRWCMNTACRQLADWIQKYPSASSLKMNVNVSNIQIAEDDIVAVTRDALYQSGLQGDHLKLEITESTLVENSDLARDILLDLKSLNISLAIDDFGTGYSSLSYLNRFPADTLKIDRSFISQMNNSEDSLKIVHIITNLAMTLGMDLVAEGIEEESQLAILRNLGCHAGQGYLFARPLPAHEAEELLNKTTLHQI